MTQFPNPLHCIKNEIFPDILKMFVVTQVYKKTSTDEQMEIPDPYQ